MTQVYTIRENRTVILDVVVQARSSQGILHLRPTVFDSLGLDRYAGTSPCELI